MILIIIIFNFNEIVNAHSNLADPLPTRELHCRVGAQHGRDCPGPCPIPDDYGRLNHPVSPKFPAATWRRGQTVKIRWHRDNRKFFFHYLIHFPLIQTKSNLSFFS